MSGCSYCPCACSSPDTPRRTVSSSATPRRARAKFEAMTERIHGHIEPNFLVFCGLSSHIAAIWRKIGFATIRIAETTEQRSGKSRLYRLTAGAPRRPARISGTAGTLQPATQSVTDGKRHHHGETGIKGPDRATEFENPTVLSPARWVFFGLPGLGDDDRAARTLTAYPQGQHLADDRQRHDTEAHPWQNSLRGRPCSHSSVTLSATLAGSVTLGVTPKTSTGSASSILASFGG